MAGTRKLERFELAIRTPQAEISPLIMAEARASLTPAQREEHEGTTRPSGARAIDREPDVEKLRTRMARRFTSLADDVTEDFADFRIGAGAWKVELTAPEGMSTGGGKRSMQHLRLQPKRQGHAVLVGGVVDGVAQEAELRDYEHMTLLYRARFRSDLEISSGEWEQFLRKAEQVLHKAKIATRRVPPAREVLSALENADAGLRKRKIATIAFAVICVLAGLVAWRVVASLL